MMIEIDLTGSNVSFYIKGNTANNCQSGFAVFFTPNCLAGVKSILVENNIETFGGTATGSKGMIGCDSPNASGNTLNTNCVIFSSGNTIPLLRIDYTDGTFIGNRTLAYITAKFTLSQLYVFGWLYSGYSLLGPTGSVGIALSPLLLTGTTLSLPRVYVSSNGGTTITTSNNYFGYNSGNTGCIGWGNNFYGTDTAPGCTKYL